MDLLSWLIEESFRLIDVKKWCRCISTDEFYDLFHPYAEKSRAIIRLLKDAKEVYLMVATLGEGLEHRVREYFTCKEFFKGYILE